MSFFKYFKKVDFFNLIEKKYTYSIQTAFFAKKQVEFWLKSFQPSQPNLIYF